MFRLIVTYVLPLLGPLLLYLAWNAFARARAKKTGGEPPALHKGMIFWCLVGGFVLLVTALVSLAIIGGDEPDSGQYISPRFEDGRIVPPRFEPAPPQ